ncbi:hypothetical protein [Brevibacterium sp. SMBL_HHYL_HB1]|jgi:hypothetical protein|uniref:hypothetical protein n=1 Tax=Brevibacterium sp. SMBL_HHYL_HB1 TaxID=2777556 RepID=UPI001BA5208D|nr:hypothetical protein [Brevibacterium sp. SMBL_HHYL_HB1]QUL78020.1 hypothetical protein IG171_11055 [Brevibacterium sp. SMBL_HHYL_HB1]
MHDTTDTTPGIEVGETAPNGLIVTAEVTLKDRSNVSVSKPTLDAALAIIRRRHHNRQPIIELAPVHARDTVCFRAGRWRVTPTDLELLDSRDAAPTTYQIEFHNFSIITPGEGSIAAKSSLATVVAAAQSLANRNVDSFELTSALPGFRALVLEPESFDDTVELSTVSELPPKPTNRPRTPTRIGRLVSRAKAKWSAIKPATAKKPTSRPQTNTKRRLPDPAWTKRAPVIITVMAVLLVGLLILGLLQMGPARQPEPASSPTWFTPAPVAQPAYEEFLDGYDKQLWELPADKTSALGWFKAGVAYVTPDSGELVLANTRSGDEVGKAKLDGPIKYTSEFTTGDTPAVAARTDKKVTVITGKGTTQTWPIGKDQKLNVTGTTPMITTKDGDIRALLVGEKDPVKVTSNPQFLPVAIDDHALVQVESGKPRLVSVPFGKNKDDATTITLAAPTKGATFVRHITAGHSLAVAEWSVDDTNYVVVHSLTDDGAVSGAAEASPSGMDWKVGRGLETAIIGNTAFNLDDGTVAAQSAEGDFTTALGPAAISESGTDRTYYLNKHTYTDPDRVIGYTSEGIALVRGSNGVVTANEKGSTK